MIRSTRRKSFKLSKTLTGPCHCLVRKLQRVWTLKHSPRYKRYDLGKQPAGTIVEIVLSCMNNVRLMDHANFQRYLETKPFQSLGGRIDKSPVRFTIPVTGKWHVVVDKAGFQTLANSNVRAIPPHGLKIGRAHV